MSNKRNIVLQCNAHDLRFSPSLLVLMYLAYNVPILWSPEVRYNEVLL